MLRILLLISLFYPINAYSNWKPKFSVSDKILLMDAENVLFISDGLPEDKRRTSAGVKTRRKVAHVRIVSTNIGFINSSLIPLALPIWFDEILENPSRAKSLVRNSRLIDDRFALLQLDNSCASNFRIFKPKSFDVITAHGTFCFCVNKNKSCGGVGNSEKELLKFLDQMMSLLSDKPGAFIDIDPILVPQTSTKVPQKKIHAKWKKILKSRTNTVDFDFYQSSSGTYGLTLSKPLTKNR